MEELLKGSNRNFDLCRKSSFVGLINSKKCSDKKDSKNGHVEDIKRNKFYDLMNYFINSDVKTIQKSIVDHAEYTLARTRYTLDNDSCYRATSFSIRDRLIEMVNETNSFFYRNDVKRCYYLSLEFLLGRAMQNALMNMDLEANYKISLEELGFNLEELYDYEKDPALGNGGLGRLAACFIDSMATLSLPCAGYGIRYSYGIFEQKIVDGRQFEYPDYWLVESNPWEIPRPDCTYVVRLYGHVEEYYCPVRRRLCYRVTGGDIIEAMAFDNPIVGYDTFNTLKLRLWKACPSKEFDFHLFNVGKYLEAVKERLSAEYISAVLYPNENTEEGKELRLKQQYFFVCATCQDILRRFKHNKAHNFKDLPKKICLQLNDTHPTLAIPEMMRLLIDIEGLEWDEAWNITKECINYTNHTVLPEALEKWSVHLFGRLFPRHLMIINEINRRFLDEVTLMWPDQLDKIRKLSIYEEGSVQKIRMANLAVIGSKHVNGVAAMHTNLLRTKLFQDFDSYYKALKVNKFINITNGVTHRRWIHLANRPLSNLISKWLGSDIWLKDYSLVSNLRKYKDDAEFLRQWYEVKLIGKRKLADYVKESLNIEVDPENMLFDIQVKRIHEYKRQLINCLYLIHRYLILKELSPQDRKKIQKRACFIGGKAAPGYFAAKTIIKLINSVADVVNNDKEVNDYLKVVFIPNYNVSSAQIIVPASDLSQHISTVGTEASGTSNMKFVMNGGLILGTLDGANIEIREECGEETMFTFGADELEVEKIRHDAMNGHYELDERLIRVFNWIKDDANYINVDDASRMEFTEMINRVSSNGYGICGDYYLVCYDFPGYCDAQELVDMTYRDFDRWISLSVQAACSMQKFTTDRSIAEYAKLIWNINRHESLANLKSIEAAS